MKKGKISNTILERSVLKLIRRRGKYNTRKPCIGQDGADFTVSGESRIVTSTAMGNQAFIRSINNIYAAGAKPVGVNLGIVLDEKSREIRLKEIMNEAERISALTGVPIIGGHTTVSDKANAPIVTANAVGCSNVKRGKPQPGQDIVLTKCIGIGGIRRLAAIKREAILERYSTDILDKAIGLEEDLLVDKEIAVIDSMPELCENIYMHDVSEGGIFAALWDLAEYGNVGLDINFRNITVRQEIIELCELFNINPYELDSLGCLLMTIPAECDIVNKMTQCGISAVVIGRVTEGNNRIIRNVDEERFMELPQQDQIWRFE